MKITYPISDNLGNDYLIRIEDFQNLPVEIIKELGDIKIFDITLEHVSGEGHTNLNILSKISIFIAGVLLDNENAILYFYCDDIHEIRRRNMNISPQKYRNDLFSAMFQRYVKTNLLQGIVDTTITAHADRDIYIHLIARECHIGQVNHIRATIEHLSQKQTRQPL